MPRKRSWRSRLGWFLAGLAIAYVYGCSVLADNYLSPFRRETGALPAWSTQIKVDAIDHIMPAWVSPDLEAGKGKPVAFLFVHGYGGEPGRWSKLADSLVKDAGVMIVATRGQTVSPVSTVGFGPGEADELIAASKWIHAHGSKKVVVVGISLGGSAAWIAASREPGLFDAVVTEGAFARLDWASNDFLSIRIPLGGILGQPVIWFATAKSGIDPASVRIDLAAAKWRGKPGLLIHGEKDTLFPVRHRDALAEASGLPVWEVPGAEHSQCQNVDFEGYRSHLLKIAEALR